MLLYCCCTSTLIRLQLSLMSSEPPLIVTCTSTRLRHLTPPLPSHLPNSNSILLKTHSTNPPPSSSSPYLLNENVPCATPLMGKKQDGYASWMGIKRTCIVHYRNWRSAMAVAVVKGMMNDGSTLENTTVYLSSFYPWKSQLMGAHEIINHGCPFASRVLLKINWLWLTRL